MSSLAPLILSTKQPSPVSKKRRKHERCSPRLSQRPDQPQVHAVCFENRPTDGIDWNPELFSDLDQGFISAPVNQLGSKNQVVIERFASTAGINSIGESLNPVLEGATNFAPGSWREGTAPMCPLAEKIGANPVQLLGP